ncbi:hypothetical protein MAR_010628 [Mya arenaria]|uniref:Uncharacterized protein n=1 Tax=Mya arenaria TaxID=6604 RepID=A0ABY7E251_MYAAR|nr:hypothetical protein MAR_010628 [Mya arenaria]
MRSGSSLTADILQQSRGAFYVYEPVHSIRWEDRSENWTYPDAPTKIGLHSDPSKSMPSLTSMYAEDYKV